VLLAVAAALVCAGCGGGDALPVEEFAAKYVSLACNLGSCPRAEARYLVQHCESSVTPRILGDLRRAIAAGRIAYDGGSAGQCISQLSAEGCDSLRVPAACWQALRGTVPEAGACYEDVDCASGRCTGLGQACPGNCGPALGQAGEPCSNNGCDSRRGLSCLATGKCGQPLGAGERCSGHGDCQDGLACIGVCTTLGVGAPCGYDAPCGPAAWCRHEPYPSSSATCQPRVPKDGACGGSADQCEPGLVCAGAGADGQGNALPGRCEPPSDEGGPCPPAPAAGGYVSSGCKLGLLCRQGVCAAPPASGPCAVDPGGSGDSCKRYTAYCDPSGTCAPVKPDGAPCNGNQECASACVWQGGSGVCGPNVTCAEP
jgi:hypothetical protein